MNGTVIVYDLDGTLTNGDTMWAFTQFTHGYIKSIWIYIFLSPLILFAYTSLLNRQFVKELILKLHYKGMSKSDLQLMGLKFSNDILPTLFNEKSYNTLQSHIKGGNKILILTASCDVWVEPWCRKHQFDFLGSQMEFIDGVCTGNISNINCRGIQKMKVLREYLIQTGYKCATAYGNEKSDLWFMTLAEKKYFVTNGNIKEIK